MLISHTRQFIFFHVSKTAGLSIRHVLEPYAEEPEKFKIRRPPRRKDGELNPMYQVWETLLLHAKARDAQKELPSDLFDSYFKFGFVRNPWDWQVSMYQFILRMDTSSKHEAVKQLGGFEEYLEWVIDNPNPYPMGTPKQQCEILADSHHRVLVDFVGRYETLARDFQHVCDTLKIDGSLPHLNATAHPDYRSYYNERTKRLVADNFTADVELFGYDFDGCVEVGRT